MSRSMSFSAIFANEAAPALTGPVQLPAFGVFFPTIPLSPGAFECDSFDAGRQIRIHLRDAF